MFQETYYSTLLSPCVLYPVLIAFLFLPGLSVLKINLFNSDWISATVPSSLLAIAVKNAVLYLDVLNTGPMGIQLDEQAAMRKGLIKSHWVWRALISQSQRLDRPDRLRFRPSKEQ